MEQAVAHQKPAPLSEWPLEAFQIGAKLAHMGGNGVGVSGK